MNKIFTSLLISISTFLCFKSSAQETHFNCGLQHKLQELYAKDPQMEIDRARLLHNSKSYKMIKGEKAIIYTIPIVFHIIHQYGSENIPDANVYDEMLVLNRDYMLQNDDTTEVVTPFDTIKEKAYIQFKLASKDPWGNCTNGIEHIYSHETTQGDDNSKLNQWHRSKYLNVWVVSSMTNGVAGYAFYPSNDLPFYKDGVIILNPYIGRLAPSSENTSRALTHEIGHFLGLAHVWGDTNNPGVACGDEGVADTPITKGWNHCPTPDGSKICNTAARENYQNYMDYSYCSVMFTRDQVSLMRYNLTNDVAQRDQLITDSVHAQTGIDLTSPPLCSPVADFHSSKKFVCQGSSVQFFDVSWRAAVDTRTWTFEGGTPATSTAANPTVTYDSQGYKKVILTVTNASGTDTKTEESYIYVSPLCGDITGPYSNDLEGGTANWFLIDNPENNWAKFQLVNGVGYQNSKCFKLNNYKNTQDALTYTDEWFYGNRLGGSTDALISPSFNLTNTSNVTVSFKYAYATDGTIVMTAPGNPTTPANADITEQLKVYTSKNCGETWTLKKTIFGAELLTAGFAGGADFAPVGTTQWKTCTFNYTAGSTDYETRVKIEFTASDKSNNFYVDNINITGTLGLFANDLDDMELDVYPNPLSPQEVINVSYMAGENPVQLTLRDVQGKVVYTETVNQTNSKVNHKLEVGKTLSSSCYFLEVKSGESTTVKKVVVL